METTMAALDFYLAFSNRFHPRGSAHGRWRTKSNLLLSESLTIETSRVTISQRVITLFVCTKSTIGRQLVPILAWPLSLRCIFHSLTALTQDEIDRFCRPLGRSRNGLGFSLGDSAWRVQSLDRIRVYTMRPRASWRRKDRCYPSSSARL